MSSALDDALAAFAALLEAHDAGLDEPPGEGEGNFRCEGCVACNDCRFCTDCENCRDCTYCIGCRDSLTLTQCRQCDASEELSHSDWNIDCVKSSYLTLCMDCEGCVQCFGCVGLADEEFCILNEKLSRKEYFAKVKELREALDQRIAEGWRPRWRIEAEEVEPPLKDETQPIHLDPLLIAARAPLDDDGPAQPLADAVAYERQQWAVESRSQRPTEPFLRAVEPGHTLDEGIALDQRNPPALTPQGRTPSLSEEVESWRGRAAPLDAELPLSEDDSGVYPAQLFEDIPPPPPYRPRSADPRVEPEEGPTRFHAPADDAPTLTRGARPVGRRPSAPGARASLRRAKRPERK